MSLNGKSIITLPSTTKNGMRSRISHHLQEGAGVVATRGDVQYVVTEYGIAYLHGKSVRERSMALINIAHPKFRKNLLEEAKDVPMYIRTRFLFTRNIIYIQRKKNQACHS